MRPLAVYLVVGLAVAPCALAQDWAVVDGMKSPPGVSGSVKPKVTKLAAGSYVLSFDQPVGFLVATSQTDGAKGRGPQTVVSTVRDSDDPKQVHVTVFRVAPDSPVGDPVDARVSLLVRPE
jgi:hypothetical protein